ncbi:beta-L-arabinofuranosidase domain-containing protein [Cellulomonas soli]|uniref:glycoside hydrolase family 127 protein n=1 Tax=Cellulomonas soli TaxID=931535 RepID=UPI0011BF4D9D
MTSTMDRQIVAPVQPARGALRPLGLDEVQITGGFWAGRQQVNGTVSIQHCDHWETRVGWIDNFRRAAAGTLPEGRTGREFSDSDVYKMVEAMAWEVGRTGDPVLEARIGELTALIGTVQEPDGYLNTRFGRPGQGARYSDLAWGHELYCYGHLLQAAVARLRTGHDDELVAIARRAADHVCEAFGPDGIAGVCGHAEIEVALVELARATGERRYLDQAALFVERRGHGTLPDIEFGREYYQDDVPVREATVLRGHSVRALYLAAGAIDLAVDTHDDALLAAVEQQVRTTLARRTYLTGGMGSHHQDEAFGDDYELPPDRAYCETCAGVGSVMVAWRLLLASGDTAWGDVVERALFNVVAVSPAQDGRSFFYTNPLHKRVPGEPAAPDEVSQRALARLRAPWFEVSCCPTNVARTVAQLAAYLATVSDDGVQLHQYAPARIVTRLGDGSDVGLEVRTRYPDEGTVTVRVTRTPAHAWELALRVPAWARGATVDGEAVDGPVARVRRVFAVGDEVTLRLPVRPRLTVPDDRVDAVRGCVAVEKGPVVLCVESTDLPDGLQVDEIRLDLTLPVVDDPQGAVAKGLRVQQTDDAWPYRDASGPLAATGEPFAMRLVPYHSWANRGPSTMRVWIPAG